MLFVLRAFLLYLALITPQNVLDGANILRMLVCTKPSHLQDFKSSWYECTVIFVHMLCLFNCIKHTLFVVVTFG